MPRQNMSLPGGPGPSDLMNLGALTRVVPMERVRAVLQEMGRESGRERQLPMHVMVYYVLGLSLFMHASCEEVLRQLVEGLRGLVPEAILPRQASKSSLSHARARLGVEPLRRLYEQLARPASTSTFDCDDLDPKVGANPEDGCTYPRPECSHKTVDDGIDNDCDGKVDERQLNGCNNTGQAGGPLAGMWVLLGILSRIKRGRDQGPVTT